MMNRTFPPLFIIAVLALLLISCSGHKLEGRWQLRQLELMDVPSQAKRFTLDLTRPDQMKADLYKERLSNQHEDKADESDTSDPEIMKAEASVEGNKVKHDIDQWVASSLNTNMTLEADNRFSMRSNGLIVPSVEPGWRFGDTLQGNWNSKADTLILTIGSGVHEYTWKYKVVKLTNKELELQEVFDGFEGRGNGMRFQRK